MRRNHLAPRSVNSTEYFLSVVVNGGDPGGRVCFYSVWDAEDAPLVRRLCALFRRKYSAPTVTAIHPPEFEYAPAHALGDDDAFLIRDEIERLRELVPKGRARQRQPETRAAQTHHRSIQGRPTPDRCRTRCSTSLVSSAN